MEKDKDKKGKKVNNEDVDKKEILHEEACFRNRFSLYQSVNKNHLCYS